jgi:WS/DGAT/MGAT family acyltransferase
MKQLGIVDSAFTNLEHPNAPQQVGGLGIYDPSTAPDQFVRFKDVLESFEQRLNRIPLFRTRLVHVPLGLDRPYFVVDSNFDVEFHIRHIALPKPGDWRQLCILVARLHSRPLDMSRPLWECYVIEGLENIPGIAKGAFAVYTKMHHCMVDGAGGQGFMMTLHDLEAMPKPREAKGVDAIVDTEPSDIGLLGRALFNKVVDAPSEIGGALRLGTDMLRTVMRIRGGDLPDFTAGGPKTRFDEPVSPHRVFNALSLDLDEVKEIKNLSGTTINDVVVTVVAGAIREYLLGKDELPDEPCAVGIPVDMRKRKGVTDDANQIGNIIAEIHTNVADPVERLQEVAASIEESKQFIDTPLVDLTKISGYFSPIIAKTAANLYVDRELTRYLPIGNCGIVTNIVGAPVQLYCAGAKLSHYHCLGLLTPGVGLCHAVFSMNNEMSISFLADRKAIPDPEVYLKCIEDSWAELKEAVLSAAMPHRTSTNRSKAADVIPAKRRRRKKAS